MPRLERSLTILQQIGSCMYRMVFAGLVAGGMCSPALAEEAVADFSHESCPFAFELPASAKLDADGIEVIAWQDQSSQLWATWHAGDIEITLACTPKRGYKIPVGYLEGICSPNNPNLTKRSRCARAERFDGIEVYYPQDDPRADVSYFWLYTGQKQDQGRITLRVGYVGASIPDDDAKQHIAAVAKAIYETIR